MVISVWEGFPPVSQSNKELETIGLVLGEQSKFDRHHKVQQALDA